MKKTFFASILALMLIQSASGAPFETKVRINGVDPFRGVAPVTPGESAQILVEVEAKEDDIYVYDIRFESSPSVAADVLNDFIKENSNFPEELENKSFTEPYDMPGIMPAGEYNLKAVVYYTGDKEGTAEYNGRIKVISSGFLDMVLGILVRILPGFISKPLVGLFI